MAANKAKGPIPEWTVREQLILASAVQRSGDQNWVSVSRAVKPLVEDARPPDYFSQKNCALQYSVMLDKAKHPKRKRSSDGGQESVVTVEEQIVHQLTEKRLKELSTSNANTKKDYHALKKETEQTEKGELDAELATMWEKVKAEIAVKESTDSKGSRSKSSSNAATPEDQPKRQKLASASSTRDDKTGTTGPEKTQASRLPERRSSSLGEAHETSASPSLSSTKRDEKMDTTPSSSEKLPISSTPTPTPTPTSSSSSASAQNSARVKRRSLESLPLGGAGSSSSGDIVLHDESPLPCPMTVPKEEKLLESIATSGGRLSRALSQPLSPDMHIIVQQPNIAAITGNNNGISGGGAPALTVEQEAKKVTDIQSSPPKMSLPSKPQLQVSALQPPAPSPPPTPPQKPIVKPETQKEPASATSAMAGELSSAQRSGDRRERDRGEGKHVVVPNVEKCEPTAQPSVPIAAPLPIPTSVPAKLPPQQSPAAISSHLLPTPLSNSAQPPTTTSARSLQTQSENVMKISVQSTTKPSPLLPATCASPSQVTVVPHTSTTTTPTPTPHPPSHLSPSSSAQQRTPPYTTPPSHPTPAPPSSSATTVVSSVLSDPRLSLGNVRPGPTKTVPLQTTAPQMQTTVAKTTKPQMVKAKSKPPGETEKKSSSEDVSSVLTSALLPELSKRVEKKEQDTTRSEEKLHVPKPAVEIKVPEPPVHAAQAQVHEHVGGEHEKAAAGEQMESEPSEPAARPESKPDAQLVPAQPSSPVPKPVPEVLQVQEMSAAGEHGTENLKAETGKAREEEKEKERAVAAAAAALVKGVAVRAGMSPPNPKSPGSPRLTRSGRKKEEEEAAGDVEKAGGMSEEQVLPDAGSSRRSSVSELPSSPLASSSLREEAEGEPLPSKGRRAAKSSSNKKLWTTRSRKRKLEVDEGMSVESTDLDSEEELSSLLTSAAPSPAPSQGDGDQDGGMSKKQWKKAIMLVWRHAAQHKYANLFLHPVKDDDAPGYRDVILRPMDLSSIKRNIETGLTTTDMEFQRDMLLMFQNAFMYNNSDHDVYHMAEKMRADVMQSIQDYLSTQLQLIVESSTPKALRSRDREGRRGDAHDEGVPTPAKKRRTRADDYNLV